MGLSETLEKQFGGALGAVVSRAGKDDMYTKVLVAVLFVGFGQILCLSQRDSKGVVVPGSVSVSAGTVTELTPGSKFVFQLRFDSAPDNFPDGQITYSFVNIWRPSMKAQSGPADRSPFELQRSGNVPLHNGQRIYTCVLPIDNHMSPGTWKLSLVKVGRMRPEVVKISDEVEFKIAEQEPFVVLANAPQTVVTGKPFTVQVEVNHYPKYLDDGCLVGVGFQLVKAEYSPGSDNYPSVYNPAPPVLTIQPNQRRYSATLGLDLEAPTGIWHLIAIAYTFPKVQTNNGGRCWIGAVYGAEAKLDVLVVSNPASMPVYPTSVSVKVNPSQTDLLIGEASRLKAKASAVRERLSTDLLKNRDVLRSSLLEATTDLDKTEKEFQDKGGHNVIPPKVVNSFFDDIRYQYGEALRILDSAPVTPHLQHAALIRSSARAHVPDFVTPALKSILHNADVYDLAASSGYLTFTLQVESEPQGATISYKQSIDTSFKFVDHPTDWQIENLPIGNYYIRAQLKGYEDGGEWYHAGKSTIPSIIIRLNKKHGRKR